MIPPQPKRVATLPCEIEIFKSALTEPQQQQNKPVMHKLTKKCKITVDELVLSQ